MLGAVAGEVARDLAGGGERDLEVLVLEVLGHPRLDPDDLLPGLGGVADGRAAQLDDPGVGAVDHGVGAEVLGFDLRGAGLAGVGAGGLDLEDRGVLRPPGLEALAAVGRDDLGGIVVLEADAVGGGAGLRRAGRSGAIP